MIKVTTRTIGLALVVGALAGCAGTGGPSQAHEVTHEWVPTHRVAKLNFQDNNVACASSAQNVSSYETCMASRGYELHQD
ncbi:MAG TPA: hypothetical protein VLA56_18935 [Pseudomonadales bacterium]|nr:hypothetical protein [Pseudomonadales bacterium]